MRNLIFLSLLFIGFGEPDTTMSDSSKTEIQTVQTTKQDIDTIKVLMSDIITKLDSIKKK